MTAAPPGDDPPDRLLARIRAALDDLPLSEGEKAAAAPRILRYARFLDSDGGRRPGGGKLGARSAYFDFARKTAAAAERLAPHGLTARAYLGAALRHPQLFHQAPERIAANVEGTAALLAPHGLTPRAYLAAALRCPTLFPRVPATIAAHIEGTAAQLAPLGLTPRAYLAAALKHPALFGLTAATAAANLEGTAARLAGHGLTVAGYLQAALRQPQLFIQAPATIAGNVARVADRFAAEGLEGRDYLAAALRHPPLFYQRPATVLRHLEAILALAAAGAIAPPPPGLAPGAADRARVLAWLLRRPNLLTLSDSNLALRRAYHEVVAPSKPQSLRAPRGPLEAELMRHLGHADPAAPVPPAADPRLIALVRAGTLKSARLAD